MKCIVIDDEPLAREGMRLLINEIPDLELVGSFSNIPDADGFLSNNEIDIIFLDIQMPLITGLDYLKIGKPEPIVVITTAYPEYALQGFEFDVADYLTKPIRFERFYKAVTKCRKMLSASSSGRLPADDMFFIRSNRKYINVNINSIKYVEALKDYVMIYTDKDKIPVSINLKSIETKLPNDKFIRINKSYIINIDSINYVEGDLVAIFGKDLTIGESYKDDFNRFLLNRNIIKRDY